MDGKFKIGWLSPTGEFTECNSFDHVEVARDIAEKLNLQTFDANMCIYLPYDEVLMRAGWAHIGVSMLMRKEWFVFWERHLTPEQISFLEPYFASPDINIGTVTRQRWEFENQI